MFAGRKNFKLNWFKLNVEIWSWWRIWSIFCGWGSFIVLVFGLTVPLPTDNPSASFIALAVFVVCISFYQWGGDIHPLNFSSFYFLMQLQSQRSLLRSFLFSSSLPRFASSQPPFFLSFYLPIVVHHSRPPRFSSSQSTSLQSLIPCLSAFKCRTLSVLDESLIYDAWVLNYKLWVTAPPPAHFLWQENADSESFQHMDIRS